MISWAIITGEYPPQPGGVSDYVRNVARQLAATGDAVTVWAPQRKDTASDGQVLVAPFSLSTVSAEGRSFARRLETLPSDTRLLLQYSPHGFGYKGMNIALARVFSRLRNHPVDVMFHEVAFPYTRKGRLRYRLLAKVQRYMAQEVAERADRIFVSTAAWNPLLEAIVGHQMQTQWLPVPSNLPLNISRSAVATLRSELVRGSHFLFGHFGTYGADITEYLRESVPTLLGASEARQCLLLGRGAGNFRSSLLDRSASLSSRIHARENLQPANVACHLLACDAMIQPFPEGVTGRRTSLMAAIALGVPTITTAGRFTEHVWQSGNGVATSSPAIDDFTRIAEDVFCSPERLRELAIGGMNLYRAYFAVEHTIHKLRASLDGPQTTQ